MVFLACTYTPKAHGEGKSRQESDGAPESDARLAGVKQGGPHWLPAHPGLHMVGLLLGHQPTPLPTSMQWPAGPSWQLEIVCGLCEGAWMAWGGLEVGKQQVDCRLSDFPTE